MLGLRYNLTILQSPEIVTVSVSASAPLLKLPAQPDQWPSVDVCALAASMSLDKNIETRSQQPKP